MELWITKFLNDSYLQSIIYIHISEINPNISWRSAVFAHNIITISDPVIYVQCLVNNTTVWDPLLPMCPLQLEKKKQTQPCCQTNRGSYITAQWQLFNGKWEYQKMLSPVLLRVPGKLSQPRSVWMCVYVCRYGWMCYSKGWPCVRTDKKRRAGCNLMLTVCKMLVTCFNTHTKHKIGFLCHFH